MQTTGAACASAPGKLILFGEHSVVYGYTAVAAALSDMRVTVRAELTEERVLSATLVDLPAASGKPVSVCSELARLDAALSSSRPAAHWQSPAPPEAEAIEALTTALTLDVPADEAAALVPLLFLCRALLPELMKGEAGGGIRITVRSADLPVGAGLGSSAAFSVALAACLLRLRLRLLPATDAAGNIGTGTVCGNGVVPPDGAKALIDGWAYAAECILHGTPSGLDNAVSPPRRRERWRREVSAG